MAVTFLTGFESAASLVDGIALSGATAYSTTQARTGTRSMRCNPASAGQGYFAFSSPGDGWFHFGLYVASRPTVSRYVLHTAQAGYVGLKLTSTGALECWVDNTLVGTTAALATGQWYWIGVRDKTAASNLEWMQVDGVGQGFLATATITTNIGWAGCGSTEASAIDIYIDDVISDNAGFLAPSKVALLLPISDNYRDTLWTGGSGGTTNLYDAVNNTPPVGSATESNTTQIEHAGGAAASTDRYDANLTPYVDVGITQSDVIIGLQMVIVWGEDISTGTKLLSYTSLLNPNNFSGESSIDVSTGHGSGAVGTYSTGTDYWNERRSAIRTTGLTNVVTVAAGMRVVRPETATRVASVCFMGMCVAWTPYVAPPVSMVVPRRVYPQLLSH